MDVILSDKTFIYIFMYFNLQFVFDYLSKTYHIEFVNSFNSDINIYYFILSIIFIYNIYITK